MNPTLKLLVRVKLLPKLILINKKNQILYDHRVRQITKYTPIFHDHIAKITQK
jgi:hypothetical protein